MPRAATTLSAKAVIGLDVDHVDGLHDQALAVRGGHPLGQPLTLRLDGVRHGDDRAVGEAQGDAVQRPDPAGDDGDAPAVIARTVRPAGPGWPEMDAAKLAPVVSDVAFDSGSR